MRALNITSILASILIQAVRRLRSGDHVLVVTNPPMLPWIAYLAALLRRCHCHILVHDVYPDVAVASGMLRERSLLVRLWASINRLCYARVDGIVVLGEDMKKRLQTRYKVTPDITLIENWGDVERIKPAPRMQNQLLMKLGLLDKFVVQYAGNHGRTHDLTILLDAAKALSGDERFHFLIVGDGTARQKAIDYARALHLHNVSFLDLVPDRQLAELLNAADVSVIAFKLGMCGVSVPSRMYNLFAAGRPLIAVCDGGSEPERLIDRYQVGWSVEAGSLSRLVTALREAEATPALRTAMGQRARALAERKYCVAVIQKKYRQFFTSRIDNPGVEPKR